MHCDNTVIYVYRQKERRKLMKMLPQNRYANSKNPKTDTQVIAPVEAEMETETKANISIKSSDDDFLNQEEEKLNIILGEEEID